MHPCLDLVWDSGMGWEQAPVCNPCRQLAKWWGYRAYWLEMSIEIGQAGRQGLQLAVWRGEWRLVLCK